MMILAIVLILSVGIGESFPSGHIQYYLEVSPDDPPSQALRVFRGTDVQSRAGPASPKLPNISMGATHPALGAGPHQSTWWWSSERPFSKRRQNLAYYNLNSFGLRYGKREPNMLAEFQQKVPVK